MPLLQVFMQEYKLFNLIGINTAASVTDVKLNLDLNLNPNLNLIQVRVSSSGTWT